jgi:hypothetical protein
MHFVNETSVCFLKSGRNHGYRANLVIMIYAEKQKAIKFIEDIVINNPDAMPLTIN